MSISEVDEWVDGSKPTADWPPDLVREYHRYLEAPAHEGWVNVSHFYNTSTKERNFMYFSKPTVFGFEFVNFMNKVSGTLHTLVHFGRWLQGPTDAVHGGAVSTMIDYAFGVLVTQLGFAGVTANLNVNFRRFVPLNEVYLIESQLDKVEGKKLFASAKLMSLDRQIVHTTCNILMIHSESNLAKF